MAGRVACISEEKKKERGSSSTIFQRKSESWRSFGRCINGCETKESARKTEEKLDGRYKDWP